MLIDEQSLYSDGQSAGTATGDVASTVLDHVKAGDAAGKEPYVVVQVKEQITSSAGMNASARLETADDSAFTTNKKVLWQSGTVVKASLVAGYRFGAFRMPAGVQRYTRIVYNFDTTAPNAGSLLAFLTPEITRQ